MSSISNSHWHTSQNPLETASVAARAAVIVAATVVTTAAVAVADVLEAVEVQPVPMIVAAEPALRKTAISHPLY
jgi:hypothetical protein